MASALSLAPPLRQVERTCVLERGRKLAYFGGCDYYRLSSHPAVQQSLVEGLRRYGLNTSASRLTTGNHPLYEELEERLARFFRFPAAVLVASGYLGNLVAAQALAGEYSPVLMDARAHPSLRDAAQLLDCPVKFFRHKDAGVLARAARACGREARPAVFTDGLFAHDGSTAPLPAYQQVLPAAGLLLVDDAHGAGTLGAHGRGTAEHLQVSTRRMVQTVTLSKAFGAYGGAILGPAWLKRKIYARSRMFAGHTPLPLPLVCAARKSLELFSATPALRERLRANAAYVKARLRAAGVPVPDHPGPIVFLAPEKATTAARLIKALRARGVYPSFIRYPGGPRHGYFRFALSSEHSRAQLDQLIMGLTT